jgi:hypothetical protein
MAAVAQTSEYWMARVAESAQRLSVMEREYKAGRIAKGDLDMARDVYKQAFRFYTDPFGVKDRGQK